MLDNLPPSHTMSSIHFCHTNHLHVLSHYIHKSHLLSSSFFQPSTSFAHISVVSQLRMSKTFTALLLQFVSQL